MGKLTGIPWGTVAAVERGRDPRWWTLMRYLARVPGLHAADLLPPPVACPPPASPAVFSRLVEAYGFAADELSVEATVKRGGATLVRHLRGLRTVKTTEPWEELALPLMQVACLASPEIAKRLEPPKRR